MASGAQKNQVGSVVRASKRVRNDVALLQPLADVLCALPTADIGIAPVNRKSGL
jgi:hypothetical protein